MEIQPQGVACTRILPDAYEKLWGVDLSRDYKTALTLNLISLPLFLAVGCLAVIVAGTLTPDVIGLAQLKQTFSHPAVLFLTLLCVVAAMMILHEGIHGLFFWIFTRSKPVFGIRLLFAYAGAPEWYIPRNQYSVVGLAPVVLLTIAGMAVMPILSVSAAQGVLLGVVMNASGAIGDLYVCYRVLHCPPEVLIQDTGFATVAYGRNLSMRAA